MKFTYSSIALVLTLVYPLFMPERNNLPNPEYERMVKANEGWDPFAHNVDAFKRIMTGPSYRCPACGSDDMDKIHHAGTLALSECTIWHCNNCDYRSDPQ